MIAQARTLTLIIATLAALLYSTAGAANTPGPVDVLKTASDQMFKELNANRARLSNNPAEVQKVIEQILLPHIDIIVASKYVLGKHWRTANKDQKLKFIRQFRNLLLRFYSTALAEYLGDQKGKKLDPGMIKFKRLRASAEDKDVTVRSDVIPTKGEPIPVNYHMHLTKKGWRVYDVSVEGISVITTYRTSFGSEIVANGLDSLIASLSDKNSKFMAQAPAFKKKDKEKKSKVN
ncbi:MAG: ABC transporter substrate-binding protein [Gammaproteobacteria bacterium]|nr:ABC transporter substrate-binding protein [Gammaproteobacteria bacterium]